MGDVRLRLFLGAFVALLLALAPGAQAAVSPQVPLPPLGDVGLASYTIVATSPRAALPPPPKLALVRAGTLGDGLLVVSTLARDPGQPRRFSAVLAVVNPEETEGTIPPRGAQPGTLRLRVPPGYALTRRLVAPSVLFANGRPAFEVPEGARTNVLTGRVPAGTTPAGIVADARSLAFDRYVPAANMDRLGLEFVSLDARRAPSPTTLRAAVEVARLMQINALEFRLPAGVAVTRVDAPAGTTLSTAGNVVQVFARQTFRPGARLELTLELDRPLPAGAAVELRASTHYFESALPFVQRVFVP
jgi:hypothetical protein